MTARRPTQLGVGLIRIGREWGHIQQEIPSEQQALAFLEHAARCGILFYDTAPSYALSEERTGKFLKGSTRERFTVATKFGEHWDAARGQPYVDHSLDALKRSLDQSFDRLGRIDVLQLHKTSPALLASDDLARAWEYAQSLGITRLGPSVSDLESANLAAGDLRYSCIQLPLNKTNPMFTSVAQQAAARGLYVIANRPYGMGAMLHGATPIDPVNAFRYLIDLDIGGVILTGTASIQHLDENLAAFTLAVAQREQASS